MNRETLRELMVFALLLAIGIVGRWVQPAWHFTPLSAVTLVGAFYFRRLLPAVLLPVGILAASDMLLPTHDNLAVLVAVNLAMLVPIALGRLARHTEGWGRIGVSVAAGAVPATTFFLVTNFVHWATTGMYEKSLAGLLTCYTAGLPFYRTMLAGDIFYLAVIAGCLLLSTTRLRKPALAWLTR